MAFSYEDNKRLDQEYNTPERSPLHRANRFPAEHAAETRQKLLDAVAMRTEHHNAVQSALGGGSPEAIAGPENQGKNDQEAIQPPARPSGRFQAWQNTIKDFRQEPTD